MNKEGIVNLTEYKYLISLLEQLLEYDKISKKI